MPAKHHAARPGPHRADPDSEGGKRTGSPRGAVALCADPGPTALFPLSPLPGSYVPPGRFA